MCLGNQTYNLSVQGMTPNPLNHTGQRKLVLLNAVLHSLTIVAASCTWPKSSLSLCAYSLAARFLRKWLSLPPRPSRSQWRIDAGLGELGTSPPGRTNPVTPSVLRSSQWGQAPLEPRPHPCSASLPPSPASFSPENVPLRNCLHKNLRRELQFWGT